MMENMLLHPMAVLVIRVLLYKVIATPSPPHPEEGISYFLTPFDLKFLLCT